MTEIVEETPHQEEISLGVAVKINNLATVFRDIEPHRLDALVEKAVSGTERFCVFAHDSRRLEKFCLLLALTTSSMTHIGNTGVKESSLLPHPADRQR